MWPERLWFLFCLANVGRSPPGPAPWAPRALANVLLLAGQGIENGLASGLGLCFSQDVGVEHFGVFPRGIFFSMT